MIIVHTKDRKKKKSIKCAREVPVKEFSGTMGLPNTFISLLDYESLIMELVRHWKSECRGIPLRGSTEWTMWIDQLHSMARLSNVPLDLDQIDELLRTKLALADYTDGVTEYAKLVLKTSLERQGDYIGLKESIANDTKGVVSCST